MEILFASGNRHKAGEIGQLFSGHTIILPQDLGIAFECEETEDSFFGNAMLKARKLWEMAKRPVLADDSGICVDALGGSPGIYSARYGSVHGTELNQQERNRYLLGKLAGISERSCRFVCCMILILGDQQFLCAQDVLEGIVLERERGIGGFGYDPVVFLPEYNKTVAELPASEKNLISHRGKAAAHILSALGSLK